MGAIEAPKLPDEMGIFCCIFLRIATAGRSTDGTTENSCSMCARRRSGGNVRATTLTRQGRDLSGMLCAERSTWRSLKWRAIVETRMPGFDRESEMDMRHEVNAS